MSKTEIGIQDSWIETFLVEAEDLLAEIDEAALELGHTGNAETINRIFRAFHTIKGSGGMCGLHKVAEFTHHIETLLDQVRGGAIAATPKLADIVLAGRDQVRALITAERGGAQVAPGSSEALIARLNAFAKESGGIGTDSVHNQGGVSPVAPYEPKEPVEDIWEISFHPDKDLLSRGSNPILLMRDLALLGRCELTAHSENVPPIEEIDSGCCYLWWSAVLHTTAGEDAIHEVFMFVEDDAVLEIKARAQIVSLELSPSGNVADVVSSTLPSAGGAANPEASVEKALAKESTVRVPSSRLDRLVNLVGELVMNQSRLTQMSTQLGIPEIVNPVQEIERLVAELRDDVLGIRMLPIGTLFSRFRRLVHDLSRELGKDVILVTAGEDTELDKSILDQLGEPLVHLLRNCIDHGIELPAERTLKGKPARGTIRLNAVHNGSTVVVRIEDDGGGINRARVRAKAIEKSLISSDANLSDKEVLNLLMLPGFSTAAAVTNISGRGVGMDVVKQQIDLLRGNVQISSEEGRGTTVALTLPLTLAIIEGLLVQVSDSRLIVPMSVVTENVELQAYERKLKNCRNVISVRGDLIPYIDLRLLFQLGGTAPEIEKIVIVEHEEQRVGFVVDRVLGTHQTVLQPLGRFLRNVNVASGATIMGDGGVALILDIASTIQFAHQQSQQTQQIQQGSTGLALRTA